MPPKLHDSTSSEKMLTLYSLLLLTSREWSLTELAEYLQCSKSTVLRLLTKIECFEGVQLSHRARSTAGRPEKCYRLARIVGEGEKARMAVSAEEMRLLHLCRDIALPLLPTPLRKNLDAVLLRASVLVPSEEQWHESKTPQLRMAMLGTIDYGPQQNLLHTLLRAMSKKQICLITYHAQDKPPRVHEMAVTSLCGGRHALYVKGWSVQSKGRPDPIYPLFLAVHRMSEVIPTRRKHLLPMTDKDAHGHFGLIEEKPFAVRVFFDSELETYIRERRFSSEQSIEAVAGGIILSFTAHSDMEVLAWLLGFGSKAKALEPDWLLAWVQKELAEMQKLYSTP